LRTWNIKEEDVFNLFSSDANTGAVSFLNLSK